MKTANKGSRLEGDISYVPITPTVGDLNPGIGVGTYKKSKHLNSQLLEYTYAKGKKGQGKIFDELEESTQESLKAEKVDTKTLAIGLDVTASERKLIDTLCLLLHEKSQTAKAEEAGYYYGNSLTPHTTNYMAKQAEPSPTLMLSIYEITKHYKAQEHIGGKDQENVLEILRGLADRKFLIKYERKIFGKQSSRKPGQPAYKVEKIELHSSIIWLPEVTEELYTEDHELISSRKEVRVVLSPLFRDQIDSYFIAVPKNITERTVLAYGSHNVSEAALRLRDYLMDEHSQRKTEPTKISQEKLLYRIAEKAMKANRKKRALEMLDKAIDTVTKLGLLKDHQLEPSPKSGDLIYYFHLNKDFS
jgi:hypothetical protein